MYSLFSDKETWVVCEKENYNKKMNANKLETTRSKILKTKIIEKYWKSRNNWIEYNSYQNAVTKPERQ